MYDDVRRPEVVDHVSAHVDLPLRPVGRRVQDHPGLRPKQLVRQAETDLLQGGGDEREVGRKFLAKIGLLSK